MKNSKFNSFFFFVLTGFACLLMIAGCQNGETGDKDENRIDKIEKQEAELNRAFSDALSDMESNYQRKADLIISLVNIFKAAADYKEQTLIEIVEGNADAVKSIDLDAENLTEKDLKLLQAVDAVMTSDFSRMMRMAENSPQLQNMANLRDFQAQMEGSENRINTSRIRYNEAVRKYNDFVSKPKVKKLLDLEEKPFFEEYQSSGRKRVQDVDFDDLGV